MNILLILSAGICPGCPNCQPGEFFEPPTNRFVEVGELEVVAETSGELVSVQAAYTAPQTVRPAMLGLAQPEGTPTAILPPKPELWVGSKVYSAVDGSTDLHGRVFGMSHDFYDVLWEDGYRGRYTRDELALVFPEG